METIKTLLDAVKTAKHIESDYALAKAMNLPKQRISGYYTGKEAPNEFICLQIAEALNKPLEEVIAVVRIEAEKDEKRRESWKAYYGRIGGIAAIEMETACTMASREKLVGREGIEPSTNGLRVRCSTN